jgi:hypothetical protein
MKFRDSSYALDPVLEEIEAKGQQGSKVLLEGKLIMHFKKVQILSSIVLHTHCQNESFVIQQHLPR